MGGNARPRLPSFLALYGHPDAGGFWEQHCETQLKKVGFVPIPDWPSVFRHPKLGTFLVVYVDDFKQSGPSANLAEGWRLIRSVGYALCLSRCGKCIVVTLVLQGKSQPRIGFSIHISTYSPVR